MMSGMPSRRTVLGFGALAAAGLLFRPQLAWAEEPDEDGYELWLRYRQVADGALLDAYRRAFTHVVAAGGDAVEASAAGELVKGLSGLLGTPVEQVPQPRGAGAVIVGTPASSPLIAEQIPAAELEQAGPEGYLIRRITVDGDDMVLVAGAGARGALYGAFGLLRHLQTYRPLDALEVTERPALGLRIANHWDNLDRSVERGYAGLSIFHWDELPTVLPHYADYARTLASVGMNGVTINNVNANAQFLSDDMIGKLSGLAKVLADWGVTLYLSANFASPIILDGLGTADPFDENVRAWWRRKAETIYAALPSFGGFLVKANSEGQPGPGDYGRTHADGANMLAEAVAPRGGIVMWRAFIHDFDPVTWAGKSYKTFQPLDGKFADNVVLQIKNGPIDFQVREPTHPLFGALPNTNSMLELQITQEYTGQTTHVCYLVPEWKQVYDFDTHATGTGPTVVEVVDGSAFGRSLGGVAGVMNFGMGGVNDGRDWTLHQLASANNHGYARLAWNPQLTAEAIAEEWVRMTYGNDPAVISAITGILLASWPAYESYTSPLGCGFMIGDGAHFDPLPVVAQPFHRADASGVGFDRTMASGTGDTGLYFSPVRETYEALAQCPDELLLFFHHVPYTHQLDSGKTVLQHIYDTHFDGRDNAVALRGQWDALRGKVDAARLADTLERFDRQVEHATVWRDTLAAYFFELSKTLDQGRAWLQVRFEPLPALLSGIPSRVGVTVGNATAQPAAATARLVVPDAWNSGTARISVASREFGTADVPVMASGALALIVPIYTEADADIEVLTGTAAKAVANVAPPGQLCSLALDGGSPTSPLQDGYRRLAPTDAWSAERGYGWVGGAPQSRDRGAALDSLRRDFCADTTPRVLRIAVPAGGHDTYLLVSDNTRAYPTYVKSGGELLAQTDPLVDGGGTWVRFTLDGGDSGREVDLELSSDPQQFWHLNALAVIDPDATLAPAALGGLQVTAPLVGGTASILSVLAGNTTDKPLDAKASVEVPDGWSVKDATASLPGGDLAVLEVAITPPAKPKKPATTTVTVRLAAGGAEDRRRLAVDVVPAGAAVRLALDAGTAESPLLDTYAKLSPAELWDAGRGYGWVGEAPEARDRAGVLADALRQDFVNHIAPCTLRIVVPAGVHQAHALVGDVFALGATTISVDGQPVAEDPGGPDGTFTWLEFPLDGGQAGREVDLVLSGAGGKAWHLNALVVM